MASSLAKRVHGVSYFGETLDKKTCDEASANCSTILKQVTSVNPDLNSWVNFAILNRTGDLLDTIPCRYGNPKPTSAFHESAAIQRAIGVISQLGFIIYSARVAVLMPQDFLRPHVDTIPGHRVILALNEQGQDFRHLVDTECFCIRAGAVCVFDGQVPHGAANLGRSGSRFAVVVDIDQTSPALSQLSQSEEGFPAKSMVPRLPWSNRVRKMVAESTISEALAMQILEVERSWILAAFRYRLSAVQVYEELLRFTNYVRSNPRCSQEHGQIWSEYRTRLMNPALPFQIRVGS